MTIQEIMNKIKDIKGNFVNGAINSDDMVECLEDLIHDVEGNDGFNFSDDEDHYESFEETDFSTLESF
tara:strand:+ start:488 stop:691 length:204 start_codon:yes stop_codon:yes gene_type:complete